MLFDTELPAAARRSPAALSGDNMQSTYSSPRTHMAQIVATHDEISDGDTDKGKEKEKEKEIKKQNWSAMYSGNNDMGIKRPLFLTHHVWKSSVMCE